MMAKFSKKMMGKEVGSASVYAKPHTMQGKVVKATTNPGKEPNHSNVNTVDMSVGAFSNKPDGKPTKTSGIKIRGTGAAIKGTMARGPMA
jgi:hypothetical protein